MTVVMAEQWAGYGPPTPVRIFQWAAEFEELLELYRERQPGKVLEVGTYHGGTLYHWLQNAQDGAVVVSVDSYAVGVDNRHLYADWTPAGVTLRTIEGDSHHPATVLKAALLAPFDWVFIDAGHYYHEVLKDWRLYGPMCQVGGVVVFHDILPPSFEHPEIEVERLWREIQQAHRTKEIVANRSASWGGIGVVFKDSPA